MKTKTRRKKAKRKIPEKDPSITQLLIQTMPAKLKKQFSIRCKENDITMKDAVIEFMEQYIA